MTVATKAADTDLYQQIQQFYARQMQLLDDGAAELWAETFTHDGVFAANAQPAPTSGRTAIAAAARVTVDQLDERRIVRRHWLGMIDVTVTPGEVRARSYALIMETPKGGTATVRMSTTCDDVLVKVDGQWLVRHREVRRDDLD